MRHSARRGVAGARAILGAEWVGSEDKSHVLDESYGEAPCWAGDGPRGRGFPAASSTLSEVALYRSVPSPSTAPSETMVPTTAR